MERLTGKYLGRVGLIGDLTTSCRYICKYNFCENCKIEKAFEKLAHYEDLEEQEKLIELPCKVGDVVYRINQYAKESILPMRVSGVIFKELYNGILNIRINAIDVEDFGEYIYFHKDIGKTVFLTKEEAKAKLKEMENGVTQGNDGVEKVVE